ncbi:MAG TPA: hypothetical protein VIG24_10990, partial [Acidimicrobiia bacterium]
GFVWQQPTVCGVFQLGHDELGNETRQRPGSGRQLVEVDGGLGSEGGEPAVAAAGFEEPTQADQIAVERVGADRLRPEPDTPWL